MQDLVKLVKNMPTGEVLSPAKEVKYKKGSPRLYSYKGKKLTARELFALEECTARTMNAFRSRLTKWRAGRYASIEDVVTGTVVG